MTLLFFAWSFVHVTFLIQKIGQLSDCHISLSSQQYPQCFCSWTHTHRYLLQTHICGLNPSHSNSNFDHHPACTPSASESDISFNICCAWMQLCSSDHVSVLSLQTNQEHDRLTCSSVSANRPLLPTAICHPNVDKPYLPQYSMRLNIVMQEQFSKYFTVAIKFWA